MPTLHLIALSLWVHPILLSQIMYFYSSYQSQQGKSAVLGDLTCQTKLERLNQLLQLTSSTIDMFIQISQFSLSLKFLPKHNVVGSILSFVCCCWLPSFPVSSCWNWPLLYVCCWPPSCCCLNHAVYVNSWLPSFCQQPASLYLVL